MLAKHVMSLLSHYGWLYHVFTEERICLVIEKLFQNRMSKENPLWTFKHIYLLYFFLKCKCVLGGPTGQSALHQNWFENRLKRCWKIMKHWVFDLYACYLAELIGSIFCISSHPLMEKKCLWPSRDHYGLRFLSIFNRHAFHRSHILS